MMVFFTFTKKMGDCIEKGGIAKLPKILHTNMGRVIQRRGVVGYIENRKMDFVKEFVT